jgi:hypothetical protein
VMAISASNDAGDLYPRAECQRRGLSKAVDVSAKGQFGGSSGLEAGSPDQFVLDRLEHRFHHRVVVAIAVRLQEPVIIVRAILAATIGMLDQTG